MATRRFALSWAAEVGLKTTVSFMLWPGNNVSGAESPEIVNPEPLAETLESVNFAVPLLLTVTLSAELEPTRTVPKLRGLGVTSIAMLGITPGLPKPTQPDITANPNSTRTTGKILTAVVVRFAAR